MSAHCVISIVLAILSSVSTAQWCNWIHSAEPVSAVTHSVQLCFVRIFNSKQLMHISENKM